jgi:hypothetical protein
MYTLSEILGVGANGVVWLATAGKCNKIALKFYEPWCVKLLYEIYDKDTLDKVKGFLKKQSNCQVLPSKKSLTVRYFGLCGKTLEKCLKPLGVSQRAKQDNAGKPMLYRIACCVDPVPIRNGVLMMPLLGKSLAGACPLTSSIERQAVAHTIRTACISAFSQNKAIPDLKPGNICRDDRSFLLIDVDDLPDVLAFDAEQWATFTIPELKGNIVATTLANAILTIAQVYGTISEWHAAHYYHFESKEPRSVNALRDLAPEEWKSVVDVIGPATTKSIALDTLAYKNMPMWI